MQSSRGNLVIDFWPILMTAAVLCLPPTVITAAAMPAAMSAVAVIQPPIAKSLPFRDRALDLVVLNDGTQLRGILISGVNGGLLVRSAWLQSHANVDLRKLAAESQKHPDQTKSSTEALKALLQRDIDELDSKPPLARDLQQIGLLREVMENIAAGHEDIPRLILLELPSDEVRRKYSQSDRNRRIGLLALLNDVAEAESASWQQLAEQLQQIPANELQSALPGSTSESAPQSAERDLERQRNAIHGAVEYRLGKVVRFIKTGSAVFPEDGPPDIQRIITDLAGQNLQTQLADLLGEPGSARNENPGTGKDGGNSVPPIPEIARAKAESKGVRTVLVSTFQTDLTRGAASVERTVYRRNSAGEWQLVGVAAGQATADELTESERKAIIDDPRVRDVSALFGALGVGAGDLDRALQSGAVVGKAANRSTATLEEFVTQAIQGHGSLKSAVEIPTIPFRSLRLSIPAP